VIAAAEVARVNLVVAVLIWLMIIPMLLKIDFGALGSVRQHWRGVGVTLFINWAVKPFSMAALATVFIGWLFAPLLPSGEISSYIAGLIILAAAP
jgi:ACR3 family arsenite transporter